MLIAGYSNYRIATIKRLKLSNPKFFSKQELAIQFDRVDEDMIHHFGIIKLNVAPLFSPLDSAHILPP